MTSSVSHMTFDAHDAFAQATWWAQVLGGTVGEDDVAGDPEAQVLGPATPLLFVNVPESKAVKNRATSTCSRRTAHATRRSSA